MRKRNQHVIVTLYRALNFPYIKSEKIKIKINLKKGLRRTLGSKIVKLLFQKQEKYTQIRSKLERTRKIEAVDGKNFAIIALGNKQMKYFYNPGKSYLKVKLVKLKGMKD